MTVSEFIAYLQTLPQDAKVEVLEEYSLHYATSTRFVELTEDQIWFGDHKNLLQLGTN